MISFLALNSKRPNTNAHVVPMTRFRTRLMKTRKKEFFNPVRKFPSLIAYLKFSKYKVVGGFRGNSAATWAGLLKAVKRVMSTGIKSSMQIKIMTACNR
jgi:hypothetical protein